MDLGNSVQYAVMSMLEQAIFIPNPQGPNTLQQPFEVNNIGLSAMQLQGVNWPARWDVPFDAVRTSLHFAVEDGLPSSPIIQFHIDQPELLREFEWLVAGSTGLAVVAVDEGDIRLIMLDWLVDLWLVGEQLPYVFQVDSVDQDCIVLCNRVNSDISEIQFQDIVLEFTIGFGQDIRSGWSLRPPNTSRVLRAVRYYPWIPYGTRLKGILDVYPF